MSTKTSNLNLKLVDSCLFSLEGTNQKQLLHFNLNIALLAFNKIDNGYCLHVILLKLLSLSL